MHVAHGVEIGVMAVSTAVAAAGIGLAYVFYGGGYREPAAQVRRGRSRGSCPLVRDKFRVDELYGLIIIRPLRALARGLFLVVDRILIDQVHGARGGAGRGHRRPHRRTFQVGDVQRYLAVFAIGIAGAVLRGHQADARPANWRVKIDGTNVEVDAGKGAPAGRALMYEFDFDDDGKRRPRRRQQSPMARFSYEGTRQLHHPGDHQRSRAGIPKTIVKQRVSIK